MNVHSTAFIVSTGISLLYLKLRSEFVTKSKSSHADIIRSLEARVQLDEGRRGIKDILLPSGELYHAAMNIISSDVKKVAIITGFPCMLDYIPPTETDGPLGALAIARSILALNKEVVLLTDECNEECLLAASAASTLHQTYGSKYTLESFCGGASFDEQEEKRLHEVIQSIDMVIAIERAGPCSDGSYRTMRMKDMTHIIAPLDDILLYARSNTVGKKIISIGIGDGGNEVGMGKIYDTICSSSIPNAAAIACIVPADHLIVSSVSNWGGYALACAVAVLSGGVLDDHVPTCDVEKAICNRLVAAGARDGITGKQEDFVDGMPLAESLLVLQQLRDIASGRYND